MKISIVTRKNGLKRLARYAAKLNKAKSEYGYFKEQGVHSSGLTYATLMAIHELGTRDGRIPARKPFSIALFENQDKIFRFTLKSLNRYMMSASNNNMYPLELTLGTFGSKGVYYTRRLFGSSKLIPNATPIRKKSGLKTNKPLIDFGELKAHMAHRSSESKEIKT